MKFKKIHPNAQLPTKGSGAAGGYDIYMPQIGSVNPFEKELFPLGFAAEVPPGYVALILPRSSTGAKKGLELINTCGVIDSDYRGEVKVKLRNDSDMPFVVTTGDRIAQAEIVPAWQHDFAVVGDLSETERGEGGFGSTGR